MKIKYIKKRKKLMEMMEFLFLIAWLHLLLIKKKINLFLSLQFNLTHNVTDTIS